MIAVEPLMSRWATPTSLVSITSPGMTGIELASWAPSKYTLPLPERTPAGPSAAKTADGIRKITIQQINARMGPPQATTSADLDLIVTVAVTALNMVRVEVSTE